MDTIELLNNTEIQEIVSVYRNNKLKKKKASYNLFSISSYNSYLENFHSDIIASLLNPSELHGQGYKFLNLFVQFLNTYHNISIDPNSFNKVIVTRETGKIDIWIRDRNSGCSIIIENKINNAPDMEDQIDRYFNFAEIKEKYKVVAIVYLSLDGLKMAPRAKQDINHLIRNIGAFTDKSSDLVHGWLIPCLKVADNMDSQSVLHQYINLIQQLGNKNMDTKVNEQFYHFLGKNKGLETVKNIVEMYNSITEYRAIKFSEAITDWTPFQNRFLHKPNYWLFENYWDGKSNFKLDVWFNIDGSASMVFWDPTNQGEIGKIALTEKLKLINAGDEFELTTEDGKYKYIKKFKVDDTHPTMIEVDDAIILFTREFLKNLHDSKNMLDCR